MKKITTVTDLKIAIRQLEFKQASEWPLLKAQFLYTSENLKPLNVIKNTFNELKSSTNFKDNLLGATVGLGTGLIAKALISTVSHNPINKIFGSLLEFGISNVVSQNPNTIKSLAANIINYFSKHKEIKKINGSSF